MGSLWRVISRKGYDVTVYNRSVEKSKLWTEQYTGTYATSIIEAVKGSDIVFSCVGNDLDLRDIMLADKAFSAMKAAVCLWIIPQPPPMLPLKLTIKLWKKIFIFRCSSLRRRSRSY